MRRPSPSLRLLLPIASVGLLCAGPLGCEPEGSPSESPTPPGGHGTPTPGDGTPTPIPASAGGLRIVVTDGTSRPIPGATVTVEGSQGRADADGRFELAGLTAGDRALVEVSAPGYASTLKRVQVVGGATATQHIPLQAVGLSATFVAADGYRFEDFETGARLVVPPNAVMRADGGGYGGAVTLSYTPLSLAGLALQGVPGELLATDPNGPPRPLATYAALTVRATTPSGEALSLAAGQVIQVELPLGDARDLVDGATLPVWQLVKADGRYEAALTGQVGTSTLLADKRVVAASLTQLGSWVAARARSGAWLGGEVAQRGGAALPGAQVTLGGGYPALFASAAAEEDGRYCLRVPLDTPVTAQAALDDGGVLFTHGEAGVGAETCEAGAVDLSLSLAAGCIGGAIVADGGGPEVGAAVWSDAATQATTGADGTFCLEGPSDRAVTVRAEGFTDRSTRPTGGGQCAPGGAACAAQLRFTPGELGWTYRLSSLELASPGVGIDLDQDGDVDNGLGLALSQSSTGVLAGIDRLLDELVDRGILTEAEADAYHDKAEDVFGDVDQSLNTEPLQQAVARGALMWILDVAATQPTATMAIYEGRYQGFGFDRGPQVAAFSGTAVGGDISVGPEDLRFTVPPEGSTLPVKGQATVRVLDARAVGSASPSALTGGILGGVVPVEDLMNAANVLIPEQIPPEAGENGVEIPKEEILASIQEALTENADFVLPGGAQAISAAMAFAGEPFSGARCEVGYWARTLEVAPAGVGFDLDGDGAVDNASQTLLYSVADVTEEVLAEGLVEEGVPVLVANQAAKYAADLLRAALSIDAVNATVDDQLGAFRQVPLMTVRGSSPATFSLYDGEFTGEGYAPGALAWQMVGAVDHGALTAATDAIVRTFAPETPISPQVAYTLTLRLARARARVASDGLSEGIIGYAVTIDQILSLVRAVIGNLQTLPALDPTFGDPLYDELEATLRRGADLDLGELGPAYSMAYTFEAPRACLAAPDAE